MQKVIVNISWSEFEEDVNSHLQSGWEIVPGTLSTRVSSCFAYNNIPSKTVASYICSVIVKKYSISG